MSETVVAFGGQRIPVNDLEIDLGYTSGFVTTQTLVYNNITYIQTFTRDGSGNVLSISQWIPQSGFSQRDWVNIGLPKYIGRLHKRLSIHRSTLPENKRDIGFLNDITKIGVAS